MSEAPHTGILIFLFTDLEDSTDLWERFPEVMPPALSRHDAMLREAVESHRGQLVKTTGDGLHAVFMSASDGVAAALAGQEAIMNAEWPVETGAFKVRMGLHTGESQERDGDYFGAEVNRTARVMGIGRVMTYQAHVALGQGHLDQAKDYAEKSLEHNQGLGDSS